MKLFFSIILSTCLCLPAFAKGQSKVLKISGMSCSSCAESVTKELNSIEGVKVLSVDATSGVAKVEVKDGVDITTEKFKAAVKAAGYKMTSISIAGKSTTK